MKSNASNTGCARVAIACGGTGGHLYPGIAIGQRLEDRGAEVMLLVSAKDVDQRVLRCERRFRVVTIPAIGFSAKGFPRFVARSWKSFWLARREFRAWRPDVLLSMGGFTSAAPALAARSLGAEVVLHEANAVPGRANRWLSRLARRAYLYFPEAASGLRSCDFQVAGMPVREQFQPSDPMACRPALRLDPRRPVLLVMGGSQGASGVNAVMTRAAPLIVQKIPNLQILHLSGVAEEAKVRDAYQAAGVTAVVRSFLTEMELALGAADAVVARAGASSIAEFAAMGLPPLLIPYPHAADDHQMANARALERTGAARVLRQADATPERVAEAIVPLLVDADTRAAVREGLALWQRPEADVRMAEELLDWVPGAVSFVGGQPRAAARAGL